MDYVALKAELSSAAYTGLTDDQIASALNSQTVGAAVDVSIGDLEGYMRLQGLISALQAYSGPAGAALTAAKELTGMVLSPHIERIQTSDPSILASVTASLGALLSAGLITQAQHDAVLALANGTTSRAQQLLGQAVTVGDIQTARAQ